MSDPILRELWEIKDGLSKECGHDLRRLFARLKETQEGRSDLLVNRTKRPMRVAEPARPGYGTQTRRT